MERHSSWDNLSQKDITSPCQSVKSLLQTSRTNLSPYQTSRTNLSPYQTSSQLFNMLDSKKSMNGSKGHELPDWMKDLKRQEELLSQKRRVTMEKTGSNVSRCLNDTEVSVAGLKNTQDGVDNIFKVVKETSGTTTTLTAENFVVTCFMDKVEIKSDKHTMHYEKKTLPEMDVNEDNMISNPESFQINNVRSNECTYVNSVVHDNPCKTLQEPSNVLSPQPCDFNDESTAAQLKHVESSQNVLDKECTCSIQCMGSCKQIQGSVTMLHKENSRVRFNTPEINENQTQRGQAGNTIKETFLHEDKTQLNHENACVQFSQELLEIISTFSETLPKHEMEKENKKTTLDQTMEIIASMKTTLINCVSALENMDDTTASYQECVKQAKEEKLKKRAALEKQIKQAENEIFDDGNFEEILRIVDDMVDQVEKENDLIQSQLSHLEKNVTRESVKPCNTLVLKNSGQDLQNFRIQAQDDHFYAQKHVEELVERLKEQNIPKCIGSRDYQSKIKSEKQTKKCMSYPTITHSFHKSITEQFSTSHFSSKKKTSFKKKQPSQLNIVYSPSPSLYEEDQFETKVDKTAMPKNLTSSDSSHSLTHTQGPYYLTVESQNMPSSIVSVASPKQQHEINESEDVFQKEDFSREQCFVEKKIIDHSFREMNTTEPSIEIPQIRKYSLTEKNMQEKSLEDLKLREPSLIEQSQIKNFSIQMSLKTRSSTKKISGQESDKEECGSLHETSSTSSHPSLQGEPLEISCLKSNEQQETFETSLPMVRSTSSCCVPGKSAADLFKDVEDEFDSLFTNY